MYDEAERKAARERTEELMMQFFTALTKAVGPNYKVVVPSQKHMGYRVSGEVILVGDSYGINVDAKPRMKGHYRPCHTGTFDVTVGGYNGKRFPPRKAGLPVDLIAEHVKDEIRRRNEEAARSITIADQVANMKSQIKGIHKVRGVDTKEYSYSRPRLECSSNGTKVKLDLPELNLEDATALLDLALKLKVGK